jgi:hypothetical protein
MKRPRRRARAAPVLTPAEEMRVEALTVAMALAPGVYARNRMFELFASAAVQRAKARAATLRGIVKHLGRASGLTIEREAGERSSPDAESASERESELVLRYQIPVLSLSRVVELTRVELATLRVLASIAGVVALPLDDADRAIVDAALARLLTAGGDAGTLARAARGRATPSTPPPAE